MMLDLVKKSRSFRRFDQFRRIDTSVLKELVDCARLSPTGGNMQPLKFIIVNDPTMNSALFPALAWAGYLKEWNGPAEGQRPTAYIVILGDSAIRKDFGCDHGIAAQSIMLAAAEKGIGGCMIGSIKRELLRQMLAFDERFETLLVCALGYPAETVVLEEINGQDSIKYYRDAADAHHVPKRALDSVIVKTIA
ncbi:MAG: nitroreductase [Candidatus Raymondbacteria bacterium RifOxyC12_full_50_8]|uniref:Nitroreductase n=1 Tax=Candidatus Raymondbacteria bacterium RIFOXYD12_FULL_49_13 TaxID=1817890 RepID=A0A1F7F3A6_UNCRA|nr:MAG: nitroreductase [Candidatus Raymondbacteria bacterium RIFOXYA2_FULL_49_16]OGJ96789.1 MAG: nitroreductase [Candidatus Raymondbacteria bacterium RifOxyC12_full_50_8]OGK01121.1 MAG: nitroreductase [Candidatus Raymondbacteria bacterium RIFOXYD12_FULL_49_13]OGP39342.1 MAG: nitroreductase [Candidatus Raymondbacteria bacterium RIFOXYB2_FULL_49_35]